MISVDVQGMDDLLRRLQNHSRRMQGVVKDDIQEAGVNTHSKARRRATDSVDVGRLRASIQLYSSANRLGVEVKPEALYAPFVEWGTGNFVDVPTEVQSYALTFKGKTGVIINRRPAPYLYPSFFEERAALVAKWRAYFNA